MKKRFSFEYELSGDSLVKSCLFQECEAYNINGCIYKKLTVQILYFYKEWHQLSAHNFDISQGKRRNLCVNNNVTTAFLPEQKSGKCHKWPINIYLWEGDGWRIPPCSSKKKKKKKYTSHQTSSISHLCKCWPIPEILYSEDIIYIIIQSYIPNCVKF